MTPVFLGKCAFCRGNGHNVKSCNNSEFKPYLARLENPFLQHTLTKKQIKNILNKYNTAQIQILSVRINAPNGMPNLMIINLLTKYYYNINKLMFERDADMELHNGIQIQQPVEITYETDDSIFILRNYPENSNGETRESFSIQRKWNQFLNNIKHNIENILCIRGANNHIIQEEDNEFDPAIVDDLFQNGFIKREWNIQPYFSSILHETDCCPICYEKRVDTIQLNCTHSFCDSCLYTHLKSASPIRSPICPICRTNISSISTSNKKIYDKYKTVFLDEL